MTTGLQDFRGWARLKMLSGLQQNRQVVRTNDAIVAAELKKNFGDVIEMPTKEDDMLVGRDVVMPNPQPVIIMPPAPVATPPSPVPTVIAVILGFILTMILALAIAFCVWYTFLRTPAAPPTSTVTPTAPTTTNSEEWNVKFFDP